VGVRFLNPDLLPPPVGFSQAAVCTGRPVLLAGQIGCDRSGAIEAPGDIVAQFAKALDNVLVALRAAGGRPTDLARMRIYTTDVEAYRAHLSELGRAYRERIGKHYPPMCLIGTPQLFEPGTLVEIEAEAYVES